MVCSMILASGCTLGIVLSETHLLITLTIRTMEANKYNYLLWNPQRFK